MAGMVPYQELLSLLRRREDELRALREERTAKDATIDFLKTKIATLQNRLAVESLQCGGDGEEIQQRLETERRRNEEMSRELQHAALEIDDLRAELKEARAEVASLQAEVEKPVLRSGNSENHNGVLKEHNVLIASVEELERELAQDTTKAAEVPSLPLTLAAESDEGTQPREFLAPTGVSMEEDVEKEVEEEAQEVRAASPAEEVPSEEAPLEAAFSKADEVEVEEDSPPEAGEVHVSASGALLNFFDTSEDAAALEAKRQRVARQIERRRQARRQPNATRKSEEAAARASSSGRPSTTMVELPLRREGVKSSDDRPSATMVELPLRRDGVKSSDDRPSATMVELPLRREGVKSSDDRLDGQPVAEADPAPEEAEPPLVEVRALSAVAPAGRGRVAASCGRSGAPDPGEGLGSPSRNGSAVDTPTLHSKFEGLRDEMKRRRSQHNVADPLETAEAVVAEAKTSRLMSFGNVAEVSPQASPPAVYRHVVRTRSGSPLRSTSQVGTPHSMSFTPLGRCFSTIQASPGGSVTLPSTPKRGMVISATGLAHASAVPAGPRMPSVGLFKPVAVTGSLAAPAQTNGRNLVATVPSPGHGQKYEDGGWPLSQSATSPPGPPASAGYVLAQASPTSHSVAAPSYAYRSGEDVPVMLSSSAAVPAATPGELDRSRRSTAMSARSLSHVGTSSSTGNLGGYTSRQSPHLDAEGDALHEAVQRFCRHHPVRLPLARLSRGVYLYGNKKLLLTLHNGKLLVRIGGGFATLESCISDADRAASVASGCRRSRASY